MSMAQETVKTNESPKEKTTKCVPTKECAAKNGMTLAECKAKCAKTCAKTDATKVASASIDRTEGLVQLTNKETEAGVSCCDIAACAEKLGISVEECKALCKKEGYAKVAASIEQKDAETAQVASAVMEKTEVKGTAKKACTSKKACCKKK